MTTKIKTTLPSINNKSFTPLYNKSGFEQYIQTVQSYPILSAEEEYNFARKWLNEKDKQSGEKIILSHLRLVISVAYDLKNYGISIPDLVASGNMGLMKALYKFDPEKGFRFSTYATFWIKAEMYETILTNWSIAKISNSANYKKVFFNLSKAKKTLGILENKLSQEQVKKIAHYLDVKESDVSKVSNRLYLRDLSLNTPQNNEDESIDILSNISDKKDNIEEKFEKLEIQKISSDLLYKNIEKLSIREQDIVKSRHLIESPLTLETLAHKYNISKERIRQIEEKSLLKLKEFILNEQNIQDLL